MGNERIFADTNLFLRFLTNDIPEQADLVERLLQQAAQGELILVTNAMVLAEIVWTLESFYRLEKPDVQAKILAILNTPGLEVAESDLLLQAILWYAEKNVDFIDAYNAAWMRARKIDIVSTFDRKHFNRFDDVIVRLPDEIAAGEHPQQTPSP